MTVTILALLAGCITTWRLTRKRTSVRVTRGIHLTLARRDRVRRFKRNAMIMLVIVMIIVVLAVTR